MSDLIDRQAAIDEFYKHPNIRWTTLDVMEKIDKLPSAQPESSWIPVSERLPIDYHAVNVTWVNRKPESYYKQIKDKPFTATACYLNGQWYWYSCVVEDHLAEYGDCPMDKVDKDIEITAWMPLPSPWKGEEE